ncbi:MAG: hypothetical protein ACRC3H_02855 [Lachnospiraceae bacterium]
MSRDRETVRYNRYEPYLRESPCLYKPVSEITVENSDVVARVCNYVLAPGLNGFVLWVLNEAIKSGKERLYFLARDGYLMYRSAKIFCEKLKLPIECRYLSCSRYSIRIPMFHLQPDEALEYICRSGINVTMKKILNRAGLSDAEQMEVLDGMNLNIEMSEVIPYARLDEIRGVLKVNQSFMKYMCNRSKEAMPNLVGYFRQEGLMDKVEYAIVDSGWVGSMQKTLNQLIAFMGGRKKMEGYYWGLYELPAGAIRPKYHCYYFKPEGSLKEKVHFSNCLFEVIFSAPHGMTLRYEKTGEGYRPCYDRISDEKREFVEKTESYLIRYTEVIAAAEAGLDEIDYQSDKAVIKKLFGLFMGRPAKDEVEVYGNCLFSDDVLEHEQQPVAAVLNGKELKDNHVLNKVLVMFGIKKEQIKESAWYEGSAARNGQAAKWHVMQYALYKYLLYLRKVVVWRKSGKGR